MSNEDTLISKLIDETYVEESEKETATALVDLNKYFEKRLNEVDYLSLIDYIEQNGLEQFGLILHPTTRCYRLEMGTNTLDFPSNWSIFNAIESNHLVFLNSTNDHDFLLDIFSELRGVVQNVAIVKDEKMLKWVFLPLDSSIEHVKWIRNYFEKKEAELFKIVAA